MLFLSSFYSFVKPKPNYKIIVDRGYYDIGCGGCCTWYITTEFVDADNWCISYNGERYLHEDYNLNISELHNSINITQYSESLMLFDFKTGFTGWPNETEIYWLTPIYKKIKLIRLYNPTLTIESTYQFQFEVTKNIYSTFQFEINPLELREFDKGKIDVIILPNGASIKRYYKHFIGIFDGNALFYLFNQVRMRHH